MSTELALRPATAADLPALAEIHLAARRCAGEAFPPGGAHGDDDVRAWVAGWDLASYDVWLAALGDEVAGYARWTPSWLDDLYVHPDHQGRGVGTALFETVAAHRPEGFCLWVFESNAPARAFYRRHGCLELERTDGSANEERAPDIRVAWPGPDPLAFLRGLIDEADLVLGDVLARRTALTRAVQAVKPTSQRDPRREAEVAAARGCRGPRAGGAPRRADRRRDHRPVPRRRALTCCRHPGSCSTSARTPPSGTSRPTWQPRRGSPRPTSGPSTS